MPETLNQNTNSPTLQLADGEEIHCGPENRLLRHIVEQLFENFDSQQEVQQTPVDPNWMPLMLYGDALCGKSLVAHGLANAWKQHFPDEKTIVITATDFARSIGRMVVSDEIEQLLRQMRSCSLLVVDDIQLLKNKPNADACLTSLLDYRRRHDKPSIVTCNSNMANCSLTERLRSRLCSGLTVCISLPYAATRKEVILRSAKSFQLSLVDEKVDQLVELTNGKAISSIHSVVASVASDEANDVATNSDDLNLDEFIGNLLRTTARRFGVRVADLKSSSRRKNTVLARATAMFLIREITPLSLVETGKLFGGRDHSTVRHACEKIKKQVAADESIREATSSICRSLDIRLPSTWFELVDDKCA